MIIKLTSTEANVLKEYNSLLYQIQYETLTGFFYCLDNMTISEIERIWPNKQLIFIPQSG